MALPSETPSHSVARHCYDRKPLRGVVLHHAHVQATLGWPYSPSNPDLALTAPQPVPAAATACRATTTLQHCSSSQCSSYIHSHVRYAHHHLWHAGILPAAWQHGRPATGPPSAADLSAVVVGVSRLVQMEFGAVHGFGECHLRDQVMRLLCGLLSVGVLGVIRSERPMGGGRSDLVVYDLQGAPLLVVEYKQRHSGAVSTHQQQDTMQLRRYLSDSRRGCNEGLLIIFDKALPNGLSAARLTRVTDRQAWAQLYSDQPHNAPAFMTQPMHHLESDPLAVGVMMGLCQAFGVQVLQPLQCD